MSTETPITDAAEDEYRRGSNDWTVELNKAYGHARSLERRNSELTARVAELEETCGGMTAKQRFDQLMQTRDELLRAGHNFGLACTHDYAKAVVDELIETRAALAEARKDSARLDWLESKRTGIMACFGPNPPMGSGLPFPFEGFIVGNDIESEPSPLREAIDRAATPPPPNRRKDSHETPALDC